MIVTTQMLRDYMSGIDLASFQEQAAEYILQGIQADLERYLSRSLEPQTVTENVPVNEDGSVKTNHHPIRSIPEGSAYYLYGGRLWVLGLYSNQAVTLFGLGMHYMEEEWITVTYTYGLDATIAGDVNNDYADVRLAIMRVASREMTNRHDDTLSVKGLNTENVGEPTGPQNGVQGWTMDELRMHDRLRRRVIA